MRTHPMRTATCQSRGYASSSRERPPRRTHCSLASPERIPPSWFRVLPQGEPPGASRSARLVADLQHAPCLTLLVARLVARHPSVAPSALAFPPLRPAVADATTASATPETVACRALTTNVPSDRTCCSLSTNWPPGMETVWFTVPSTGTATPLIERLEMYEVPSPE